MSLEEELRDLTEAVQGLTRLLELQQGIEAGELMMNGPGTPDESGMEFEVEAGIVGGESEPPPSKTIEGMNEKTLALINLSNELGYKYLLHDGALAVDNRVLDEFNRRSLPDTLEP